MEIEFNGRRGKDLNTDSYKFHSRLIHNKGINDKRNTNFSMYFRKTLLIPTIDR